MTSFPRLGDDDRDKEPRPRSKRPIMVAQLLFYAPLAVLGIAGIVIAIVELMNGQSGIIILLGISILMTIAFGYQAVQFMRDLPARPVMTEGEVARKWTKANLFFFFVPSFYIHVQGKIFAVSRWQYASLLDNDLIRIQHYPHSLTVELLEIYDTGQKKFVVASSSGVPF